MTGKELWDYMSAIQGRMQPGSYGHPWEEIPDTVQYVWIKAGIGLDLNGKVVDGVVKDQWWVILVPFDGEPCIAIPFDSHDLAYSQGRHLLQSGNYDGFHVVFSVEYVK